MQHQRERFHPFNTARIVRRALVNSHLIVNHPEQIKDALSAMTFDANVGLLYPDRGSQLLTELPIESRPTQLVILDGTWHHTKTLLRDIPLLQHLPKYRLAPSEPSRYTIRREPNDESISTLEATVAALRCLEPETTGLTQLLEAFLSMIADQLSLPKEDYGARRNLRRNRPTADIPKLLRERQHDIVVVYGETTPGVIGDRSPKVHRPVYWVAERLVTGERFECPIRPTFELSDSFLGHLELNRNVFEQAPGMDEFSENWQSFVRPTDVFAFYYSNIQKLLLEMGMTSNPTLHLKCIKMAKVSMDAVSNLPPMVNHAGRAGRRLAISVALARYLYRVANE